VGAKLSALNALRDQGTREGPGTRAPAVEDCRLGERIVVPAVERPLLEAPPLVEPTSAAGHMEAAKAIDQVVRARQRLQRKPEELDEGSSKLQK